MFSALPALYARLRSLRSRRVLRSPHLRRALRCLRMLRSLPCLRYAYSVFYVV